MAEGTTAADLFADDRSVVVARVGGQLVDLAHVLHDGDVVEAVTIDSPDGLDVLRHSTAHVLAQAVQQVNPKARLGIGPPIRDGFYYDFDVEIPFTPDDLKELERVMQRIINEGQTFSRRVTTDEDARARAAERALQARADRPQGRSAGTPPTGADAEVGGGELTIYDNHRRDGELAWKDLCRGPHLPTTKLIGNAFKLTRSAAAYWRGCEKNPQLQRVYGTAWPTKDDLKATSTGWPRPRSATTASSAPSWTSTPSPTSWAPAWRSTTPRAASSSGRWRTTSAGGTSRRGSTTSGPRTSPRTGCSTPRATCRTSPRACSRPSTSRARSTASRR